MSDGPRAAAIDPALPIELPLEELGELCRRYQVQELSLFGSALRNDFRPDSDLDFLVLFEPDAPIGFLGFAALQRELSQLVGRPVDLVSKRGLNRFIRDEVLGTALVIYGEE